MRIKILFAVLALSSALALGQGAMSPPQTALKVVNGTTSPIANATITVCAALTGGIPCSPALTSTIFSDIALTQPLPNPFTTDAQGNYQFAAAAATYTVTVTASRFAGYSYQLTLGGSGGGGGGGLTNQVAGQVPIANTSTTANQSKPIQGAADPNLLASGTVSGVPASDLCTDVNGGATTLNCPIQPITGGNTVGGINLTSVANWDGLLGPNNPAVLDIPIWIHGSGHRDYYMVNQGGDGTAEARQYFAWLSHDGNYRWLMGKNANAPEGAGDFGNFILYDSTAGGHRIFMQSKFDGTGGQTVINSNGNFPVCIQCNTGLDNLEGTGGFQVQYGGGATPSTAISSSGSTGVTTFNVEGVFSDPVHSPILINAPTSNSIPALALWPSGGTPKFSFYLASSTNTQIGTDTATDVQFNTNSIGRMILKGSAGSLWTAPASCHDWTSAANLTTVDTSFCRTAAGIMTVGKTDSTTDNSGIIVANGGHGTYLVSTNTIALPGGSAAPVKLDTGNANQVVVTTTTDTGAGIAIGVCIGNPTAGNKCPVVNTGVVLLTMGTGTCSIGQFVIVDTTSNADVKCTSTYTAGTVIGTAMQANSSINTTFNVLMGLR